MTQRGGKLAKEGKTLAHKHFERSLLEIETLKPGIRLDPNEDRFNWDKHSQRYTNMVTQAMWLDYTIAQAEHRNYARGNFIVAHADEKTGKPVFTESPYVHTQYKLARVEMKRLASRFRGRRFILYNSIQMEQCDPHAKERPLLEGDIDTGLIDDNGVKIFVSDTLRHYTGKVLVVCMRTEAEATSIYGEDPSYDGLQVDLKDGRGYKIVRQCSYDESPFKRFMYMSDVDTGFKDSKGINILVGDMLESEYDFRIVVKQRSEDNSFFGALVCDEDNSCKDIPYSLNEGKGYTIVEHRQAPEEEAALDEQFALTESAPEPDHGTFVLTIDKGRPEGDMSSTVRYNLDEDQPRFHPDHASD